jgi:exosortase K
MNWNKLAQILVVLGCAFALKLHYSTASADQLRWILAPTTALVEVVSGVGFEFEARAGYLSRERGFLIAASCAGVNFLLTAFLLLTLRRLLRSQQLDWAFIPSAALVAYLVTLAANTTRIVVALWLRQQPAGVLGLEPAQLHRLEGIVIYFGFLLLLFVISERLSWANDAGGWRPLLLPLLVYYAMTLGLPLVNPAHLRDADFRAHALAVLLLPLLLLLPFILFRLYQQQQLPTTRKKIFLWR